MMTPQEAELYITDLAVQNRQLGETNSQTLVRLIKELKKDSDDGWSYAGETIYVPYEKFLAHNLILSKFDVPNETSKKAIEEASRMLITHEFWQCPHCGEVEEILDEDRESSDMYCTECGYSMDFDDFRFQSWTEEY